MATEIHCHKCGTKNTGDAKFCSNCGESLCVKKDAASTADGLADVLNSADPEKTFVRRFAWIWSLRGRSTRKEFLIISVLCMIAYFVLSHKLKVQMGLFNESSDLGPAALTFITNILLVTGTAASLLAVFWVIFALFVRRLHDTGRSVRLLWGLVLLAALPVSWLFFWLSCMVPSGWCYPIFPICSVLWYMGIIWLFILFVFALFCEGVQGPNQYGEDPNPKRRTGGKMSRVVESLFEKIESGVKATGSVMMKAYKKLSFKDKPRKKLAIVIMALVLYLLGFVLNVFDVDRFLPMPMPPRIHLHFGSSK
ncbi:MAG: DUF805 domain-containing protein [Kiritimatiellae bacterium]|nr:DUF805 domain-containing protein [Kiritimatiellia bacterium]